jgi:hypothetical protein
MLISSLHQATSLRLFAFASTRKIWKLQQAHFRLPVKHLKDVDLHRKTLGLFPTK